MSTDPSDKPLYKADKALACLQAGNLHFINGQARFPIMQKEVLADLAWGKTTLFHDSRLSDSRVPPELVLDAGFCEQIVIRVAGNVSGTSILGTLQYAGLHLQTTLFVVMGHEAVQEQLPTIGSRQIDINPFVGPQAFPAPCA